MVWYRLPFVALCATPNNQVTTINQSLMLSTNKHRGNGYEPFVLMILQFLVNIVV